MSKKATSDLYWILWIWKQITINNGHRPTRARPTAIAQGQPGQRATTCETKPLFFKEKLRSVRSKITLSRKILKILHEMSIKNCVFVWWICQMSKSFAISFWCSDGRSDASKYYDERTTTWTSVAAISASWRLFNTHRTLPASQLRIRNRQNHMKLTLKKLKWWKFFKHQQQTKMGLKIRFSEMNLK